MMMNLALWCYHYPSNFRVSGLHGVSHRRVHEPQLLFSECMMHGYFRYGIGFSDGLTQISGLPALQAIGSQL